jgi:hypothetical protein
MWKKVLKWGVGVAIVVGVLVAVYKWGQGNSTATANKLQPPVNHPQAFGTPQPLVRELEQKAYKSNEAPQSPAIPTPKGPLTPFTPSLPDAPQQTQTSFDLVPPVPPTGASPPIVLVFPKGTYTVEQKAAIPDQPKFATPDEKATSRKIEGELVSQMFSPYASKEVRVSSAQDLGDFPYGRVAKVLSAVLSKDTDSEVRCAAARSLGKVANASFLPFLKNVAETDPDPAVRKEAAESIDKILVRANIPANRTI